MDYRTDATRPDLPVVPPDDGSGSRHRRARRRWPVAVAVVAVLAGVATALYLTGGMKAAPSPRPVAMRHKVDLGRYTATITDAVFHHRKVGAIGRPGVFLDVIIKVRNQDHTSVPVAEFAQDAVTIQWKDGPALTPAEATASSAGGTTAFLSPAETTTVTLAYGIPDGATVPATMGIQMLLFKYDHRADFFYGHLRWIPKKVVGKEERTATAVVQLSYRKEGI